MGNLREKERARKECDVKWRLIWEELFCGRLGLLVKGKWLVGKFLKLKRFFKGEERSCVEFDNKNDVVFVLFEAFGANTYRDMGWSFVF